jgi:uncharacterized repeat protein (TIGR03803 family)
MVFLCAAMVTTLQAQVFTSLFSFSGTDGGFPTYVLLAQGLDGSLYGTSSFGGTHGYGTIFKVTTVGTLITLYDFCALSNCADGAYPEAGLTLAPDGSFYGTTEFGGGGPCNLGGTAGCGTIFKITPSGVLSTLHSFSGDDGAYPLSQLTNAADGKFYGTTEGGGTFGGGTIFRITASGIMNTVRSFAGFNGSEPYGGVTEGSDGNLYGTTKSGGSKNLGTVFKLSPVGRLTTLYSFCVRVNCVDGAFPQAALIEAADGNFYGTTYQGGDGNNDGTVFQITRKGTFRTLHRFNLADGTSPLAPLVQGTDGNLYSTTYGGGMYGSGTIFEISRSGELTTLYSFCKDHRCPDGYFPYGGLTQGTDGNFYGTTYVGGVNGGAGTIFSLDMSLGPCIKFVNDKGRAGQTGGILGQKLTGTTGVLLGGISVDYTVVSDTFVRITIPSGATTGFVTVTTPSGILQSNVPFRVLPQLLSFDPPSGPPGTQVTITGVSLTQTLGVGFGDRVQSQFAVNSDTSVTATVPQGAKTGKIGIETKGGVAISQGTFEVTE